MPNSTSKTSICDRALQILGMAQVGSVPQVGSAGAKAMERAYTPVKLSELTKHYWHFSIKRAALAASSTPPVHTKASAYPLPGDYLMLAPEDIESDYQVPNDWIVEGGHIITNDTGQLLIRYVSSDVTEALFDAIFAEALAAALAVATGRQLTNSAGVVAEAAAIYDEQIEIAKLRGSIIQQKPRVPVSPWISRRL